MIWIEFIISAVLIVLAASFLARYADILADKTGLGQAVVGAILLAGVTSLPELVSGVTAVAWLKAPNLAAGGILGSCLFNLGLIALMDLLYQPGPILSRARDVHILSAGLGVLMLAMVAAAIFLGPEASPNLLGVSAISFAIILLYALGARLVARLEQRRLAEYLEIESEKGHYEKISLRRAWSVFVLLAVAVILLGVWISILADQLAASTGLSRSFVGALFLAASTSLPEVASSVAAIRLGAIDLAIANVLGSNLFNILLLAVYDVVDGRANFFTTLSAANGFSAVMAVMMSAVVIISLIYRASPRTPYRLNWDGLALLAMYISSMLILYRMG